jgi:hypothetical protein
MEAIILDGPSSVLTSSAFFSKLGGSPIGLSSASNEDGRLIVRSNLLYCTILALGR